MPRVYIGRLSYHVREKDVQRFFGAFGKLLEVDLKNGYGFVEFEDNRDADDAVYECNGKELCGERVIVEHARGPRRTRESYGGGSGYSSSRSNTGREKYGPPVRTEYRLTVENLSSRCSWQDLKDFMRQAGEVTYADAHKERANEGVIEFRNKSDMKHAIDKFDGMEINGRKIRLVEDRPRRRRSYSGSRSRSRSRRRSHSRSRRSRSSRSPSRSKSRSGSRSNKRSKSGDRKSTSRRRRSPSRSKSKSRSHRSGSPSPERKSKSRSKSRSKVRSERDSRSRSKEEADQKSRSRSPSPVENGNGERDAKSASRSPSPREDERQSRSKSKSREKRSVSGSRSRSASQD
ncbi:serine and arginine rich splicing factor 6b isoform X2 [Entelurus aequoreus]|uniref:serine and arginine rich splicing factor 6b isoform X2 n=1 Tax=Entelurus aequoreus TaxID=161455 RepID=UPI002B1D2076|nr:serine and arginine rich splicing factor 6b isoform X2 [Entelurus aequoreus]